MTEGEARRHAIDLQDIAASLEDGFDVDEVSIAERYDYIVAWGLVMMSLGYYVHAEVAKAQREGAPSDAYHFDEEKGWLTFDSIENDVVRRQMEAYVSVLRRNDSL